MLAATPGSSSLRPTPRYSTSGPRPGPVRSVSWETLRLPASTRPGDKLSTSVGSWTLSLSIAPQAPHWMFAGEDATVLELARAALGAGDAVMSRLWSYVKDDGGRIDEQIDKHTGGGRGGRLFHLHY